MLEDEYFGPKIGTVSLYETAWTTFNQNCSTASSKVSDSTGQRMYAGAHVAVRFLVQHPFLLDGQSVVELGCGTGVVGLLAMLHCKISALLLTDGMPATLEITNKNIDHLLNGSPSRQHTDSMHLEWGDLRAAQLAQLLNHKPFDVVIGCELMYYRTDVCQLVETVLALCSGRGLFLHCHVFRGIGQEQMLIDQLAASKWKTLEVRREEFIAAEELSARGEWYRVRALVSGPCERIDQLQAQHPSWRPFQPIFEDDLEEPAADSMFGSIFL